MTGGVWATACVNFASTVWYACVTSIVGSPEPDAQGILHPAEIIIKAKRIKRIEIFLKVFMIWGLETSRLNVNRSSVPVLTSWQNFFNAPEQLSPWKHHSTTTGSAFQADICSHSVYLPLVSSAGMFFAQLQNIIHIELRKHGTNYITQAAFHYPVRVSGGDIIARRLFY